MKPSHSGDSLRAFCRLDFLPWPHASNNNPTISSARLLKCVNDRKGDRKAYLEMCLLLETKGFPSMHFSEMKKRGLNFTTGERCGTSRLLWDVVFCAEPCGDFAGSDRVWLCWELTPLETWSLPWHWVSGGQVQSLEPVNVLSFFLCKGGKNTPFFFLLSVGPGSRILKTTENLFDFFLLIQ